MTEVAELSATEVALRELPLLKEYAAKMGDVAERLSSLLRRMAAGFSSDQVTDAVRVLCLHNALDEPVRKVAQGVSGLIEHSNLEYHLRAELKLRLLEIEEHLRFSQTLTELLVEALSRNRVLDSARKLAERSGHYKAPF